MKNRIISALISMAMCIGVIIEIVPTQAFAVGNITSVSSATDLSLLASEVNSGTDYSGVTVTLNSDIDLSGITYTPIGNKDYPFKGTFNGNGKKITGLDLSGTFTVTSEIPSPTAAKKETVYVGLFGYLGEGGSVNNLTVQSANNENQKVYDERTVYYGYIAGYSEGNIENCITGGISRIQTPYALSYMGGVVGFNAGIISGCKYNYEGSSDLRTNGSFNDYDSRYVDSYVGLIAGTNGINGKLIACTAKGKAGAVSQFAVPCVGGIAGDNKGYIVGCDANVSVFSTGKFSLNARIPTGALAGCNNGSILDSKSTGIVSGRIDMNMYGNAIEFDVGGFVGYNNGEITDCNTYDNTVVRSEAINDYDNGISHLGGFVGYNSGNITSCYAENVTVSGGFNVMGGFVGLNDRGRIEKSYVVNATVNAPNAEYTNREIYSGGFAGMNKNGVIHLSYADADITNQKATYRYNGGIVSVNDSGIVDGCYVIMDKLTGDKGAGVCYKNTGTIKNSYVVVSNTQLNESSSDITDNTGEVKNVFFNDSLGSGVYATAKSLEELKNLDSYKTWALYDIMVIGTNGYPTFDFDAVMDTNKGLGTETSPYLVYTEKDLDNIRYSPSSYYRLCNDISLTGKWSPIGMNKSNAFNGNFDGNGYTISNLNIEISGRNVYAGLFGYCDSAVIKNLNIKNAAVKASTDATVLNNIIHVGTVAGYAVNTIIENCAVESNLTATGINVTAGLLAGHIDGTLTGSIVDGTVTVNGDIDEVANLNVGGAVGSIVGAISETYANVPIDVMCVLRNASVKVGGVVGTLKGSITDCGVAGEIVTETNSVSETLFAGGIVGVLNGDVTGTYANITATGNAPCDGVAGNAYNNWVDAYYNNTLVSYYGTSYNGASMSGNSFLDVLSSGSKFIRTVRTSDNAVVPVHVYATRKSENLINTLTLELNGTGNIYYTTDGSDPLSGTLYGGEAITMNNITQVRLAVESNGIKSEINPIIVDRGGAVNTSDLYFSAPLMTVDGDKMATPDNIKTSGGVYTSIYSANDIGKIYVYICSYNEAMRLNNVILKEMDITSGENRVEFKDLMFTDSDAIWKVYAWGEKQKPLIEQIKLENGGI